MSRGMSIVAPGAFCRTACLTLVMLLGACKSINGQDQVLTPNRAPEPSGAVSIPADVDPLAPNWHVVQYDLGNGRYAISMTKRRLTTGGDGESPQIFRRRVDQIQREQGFAAYEVIEFSEGIESNLPIAQRVSRGIVQFVR
jgi:hypothetical protein